MEWLLFLMGVYIVLGVLTGVYVYSSGAMSDPIGDGGCGTALLRVIMLVVFIVGLACWPLVWLAWWIARKV